MGHAYRLVQWNPFKRSFDLALAGLVVGCLGTSIAVTLFTQAEGQSLTPIQVLIRAFGATAFTLLTLILAIGPLSRLNKRFLPALYNRRHLGVVCFLLSLVHAALVLLWNHGFSDLNPLVSLLISNPRYDSIGGFPFEALGLGALLILFVLAATSHDFWNANLGPGLWKAIHMSVYLAYTLIVAHVLLGAVQSARLDSYAWAILAAAFSVTCLHVIAGVRARAEDKSATPDARGWIAVGVATEIPNMRARIVTPPSGERIAVFRSGDQIFALSNVCRHQGRPLGEGRVIDGCVVCPWHGFQYRPDGRSPPPFNERVSTYDVLVDDGFVYVDPRPRAETANRRNHDAALGEPV
jgi:methionine sulfoxide reductase heme-binding subunit